jgi:hypothetical protein
VFLRRSVSDAYYAVFHALARLCADTLIGNLHRNSAAWVRVYRGLDHGQARQQLAANAARDLNPTVKQLAIAFEHLQQQRHSADYDPTPSVLRRADVEALIALAEAALQDVAVLQQDLSLSREMATLLLIKKRS